MGNRALAKTNSRPYALLVGQLNLLARMNTPPSWHLRLALRCAHLRDGRSAYRK